jgi:uracil-DNA glycosylase
MSSKPTAAALIELLEESKEHARFLGELGVETADLAPVAAADSLRSSAPVTSGTATRSDPIAPPAAETFLRAQFRSTTAPAVTAPGASRAPDSLFEAGTEPRSNLTAFTETLEQIWQDIGDCTRCGLCEGRTQVVQTHGNHHARLMFVGEAPGADEDIQGKPFVGRAGQLLTKMIEAMGMKREDVIIGNVNRCRPPGNRQPTLEEAAICRPFLFREIAAIRPEVIVVMGNTALRNLLELREGISRVRGQFREFRGIKVMPTFHPAYLLRDPSKKRETWEDLKKVRDYLEQTASP